MKGVEILKDHPLLGEVLTEEALQFVVALHREFNPVRKALLERRKTLWERYKAGEKPDFLEETAFVRGGSWQVAEAPPDLQDRRVEITGPVDRKMIVNALNSGAKVFMADFEDALSPTWDNVLRGQKNLYDAVRRQIDFVSPEGKAYRLKEKVATLVVRPRGWHLPEKHVLVDGEPISASLFDFGLYFFHNAHELLRRGSGPYFYLPKLESHLEARLWNQVFNFAQDYLGLPRGTIRATVLIETILAAFEMEEILYELKEHAAGFPDRAQVTMTVPFMKAYTELLVKSCHIHEAHAIGGMAAFIPSRKDPEINERAFQQVRADKEREASQGFDGTWVAHPDLVPVAMEVFDRYLGDKPHQKHVKREDVKVSAEDLLNFTVPGGKVTEGGLRNNISVALQYLNQWLLGNGAAAIFNLMEDAATAEISRAQLWQWVHQKAELEDGRTITPELYQKIKEEELSKLGGREKERYREAEEILDRLVLSEEFVEFLTLVAYEYID
jgi:malate synthase